MRRLFVKVVVFLLIGAAITVLTAWACAAVSKSRMFDARLLGRLRLAQYEEDDRLTKEELADRGDVYLARVFVSPGTRLLIMDENRGGKTRIIHQHAAGWPMLALQGEQTSGRGRPPETTWSARMGIIDLEYESLPMTVLAPPATAPATPATAPAAALTAAVSPREKADHLLPLRPIWRGFAIDVVFYAAMSWILWLAFIAAMRIQRRVRRRCGHCSYPIGASPICTECGRKVRPVAKLSS